MSNSESSRTTCISSLKSLDNLLKCGICYEYLKTTLITPCSHNYCSYCIRKFLMYKKQCPSCFEETTEPQLRNNRDLDEVVAIFSSVKDTVIRCLVNSQYAKKNIFENTSVNAESKEEIVSSAAPLSRCSTPPPAVVEQPVENPPGTSSSSNNTSNNDRAPCTPKKDIRIPSIFSPRKQKITNVDIRKVACPVCSVEIPETNINTHLDACLKRSEEKCASKNERRKPLPKLVYTLVKEKELRKKLSDLGLSSLGDRNTLINRHKRYTLLYNSECDSLNPRPVSEVIAQLKNEEEEEKKITTQSAPVAKLNVDRKADPKANEQAQRQYLEENKSSFQKLIESIQRNKQTKKDQKNEVNIDSDEVCIVDSSKKKEIELISVDDTSASSNHSEEAVINRASKPKRKRILSETEESSEDISVAPTVGEKLSVEVTVHSPGLKESGMKGRKSSEKAESSKKSSGNGAISRAESNGFLTLLSELLDNVSNDSSVNRRNKGDSTPELRTPSKASSLLTLPVLGSRSKVNITPTANFDQEETRNREGTPDIFDSDATSNDSVSLMVYQGPESLTPLKTTSYCMSPVFEPEPRVGMEQNNNITFSMGIDSILQDSEDFEKTPPRRRRTRGRERSAEAAQPSTRSLRKRVKK